MSNRKPCFVAVNKLTGEINVFSAAGNAGGARIGCTETSIPGGEYDKGRKHAWQYAFSRGWRIRKAHIVLEKSDV